MYPRVVLVAFLVGCVEEKVEDSAEPYVAPLAPSWFAITGSTYDGAFKSTCTMSAELVGADDSAVIATVPMAPADGGLWAGVELPAGTQVKATLSWNDCENTGAGTGSFPSSTFSGSDGDLFVMHYDGVDAGFEWMVQATDHLGGEVRAQFGERAPAAEIDALVADLGLTSAADPDDATFRILSWTEPTNVADVLGQLSQSELYVWGEPTWVEKPAWW